MNEDHTNSNIYELQQKINEISHDLKISNQIFSLETQKSEIALQAMITLNKNLATVSNVLLTLKDLILQDSTAQLANSHKNPLNHYGQKCFSQTDEDGITIEIVRRLGIEKGVYAEFGVGNGSENNTLILAAMKWKGFWVGGQDVLFPFDAVKGFHFIKDWITLENILTHTQEGMKNIGARELDVVSIDLDFNDYFFVEKLLKNGVRSKVYILEYNAKFPPPVRFVVDYEEGYDYAAAADDYFGASLQSFVDLMTHFNYKLVCCNSHTGANAFFVDNKYKHLFTDIPTDIRDIYIPPRYVLFNFYGHQKRTMRTVFHLFDR
jgi:hypothetical protein